jgi:tetratricopeptide (TPR) repeat protein
MMIDATNPEARAGTAESRFVTACLGHARDLPDRLADYLAASPDHPRPHAVKAIILVTLARAELLPLARDCAAEAQKRLQAGGFLPGDAAFVEAAQQASLGLWREAIRALDRASLLDPDDALPVKMAHGLRFMLGDARGMLTAIEESLARMGLSNPHRGFLMGCKAFALEETGQYLRAEIAGREALALRPDDAWGLHAVSHVHEMTGRVRDGIDWIEAHAATIRGANNFAGHLYWHLALFHLEQDNAAAALALYDAEIRRERTDDFRDIANAASLLMRLELMGHAVGQRWEELADKAEARMGDRVLLFADLHYALALMGAGRKAKALQFARSIRDHRPVPFAQEAAWITAGQRMGAGLSAFIEGDAAVAFEALAPLAGPARSLGGSHAQRDILEQITIEAGLRAGADQAVQKRLLARLALRGGQNRFAETRLARLTHRQKPGRGVLALLSALTLGRNPAAHHA